MRSLVRRLAIAIGAAGVGLLLATSAAEAKVLPVDSVTVATARPTAGYPVDVVVRFGKNFDLGDFEWENNEVAVLPAARTDADGWPLDRNDRGVPVRLHRVSKGVYRGSFVVAEVGEYVVVDWSSFYAKEDRASGVVTTRSYAVPIRVRIEATTPAPASSGSASTSVSGSTSHDQSTIGVVAVIACIVTVAGVVAICRRRRRARRHVEMPARHDGDHILVDSGSHQN